MAFGSNNPDRRFRRFCRTGDPDALGDVFDATAGQLMRVALWLAGNRPDAEDVLQRTFLQAIETREKFRASEPVMPWLMGLLGNQARKLRRERDRAATLRPPIDRVADPAADAAASELDAAVAAVRDRLGEPYREVLQLHLERGFNAKEIAAQLGRPAGTVRTQMMRALDLLRRKLPGGFVAGLAAIAALDRAALATMRGNVVAVASATAPVATGTSILTTTTGLIMSKTIFGALSVLVLGGLIAWSIVDSNPSEPLQPGPALATEKIVDATGAGPVGAKTEVGHAPQRVAVAAAPIADGESGLCTLRVVVRWQDDGTPATGMGIGLVSPRQPDAFARRATLNTEGVAQFEHVPPGDYRIRGAFLIQALRPPGSIGSSPPDILTAAELRLPPNSELSGAQRGYRGIENRCHWVRDVTFDEDRSRVRSGSGPQVMASLRDLALSVHRLNGERNIAAASRAAPERRRGVRTGFGTGFGGQHGMRGIVGRGSWVTRTKRAEWVRVRIPERHHTAPRGERVPR